MDTVSTLRNSGFTMREAMVLTSVNEGNTTQRAVCDATGLAQPSVSVTVRNLIEREFLVQVGEEGGEGRGRPTGIYEVNKTSIKSHLRECKTQLQEVIKAF